MKASSCKDCKYFLPLDVFTGICKLSKEKTSHDDSFCVHGEQMAKCKFCAKFTLEKDYLGKCMGTTLAYPDMAAGKCRDFQWYKQN
jgi:hypothetical protein